MPSYSNVWLCDDCTIAEVNGDYSGMTDERAAEVSEAFKDLPGRVPSFSHLAANWNSETDDGINPFSFRPCFCCGSRLGGMRHRFALFGKEA